MSDIHTVGLDLFSFSNNGMRKPVSRITLYVNNEDDQVYTAGDDTGLELSATCIYATEEMAKTLLSMAKGAQYQMYEAQAANLDPAAELGDGIEVGGITSVIAQINDNGDGYPDVSASGEQEVEDEYPGASRQGPIQRELARARSLISKTNDRISMEIYGEDNKGGLNGRMNTFTMGLRGISNEIKGYEDTVTGYEEQLALYKQDLEGYSGKVSKYTEDVNGYKEQVISFEGSVEGFEQRVALYQEQAGKTQEAYSLIDQKVNNITLKVTNNDATASIQLVVDGKNQGAPAEIKMNGLVTFSALGSAPGTGQTKINGGWIEADTLKVKAANISGRLTFNELPTSVAKKSDIKDAATEAAETYIDAWKVSSPTIEGLTVAGGVFTDYDQDYSLYLDKTYDSNTFAMILEDDDDIFAVLSNRKTKESSIALRGYTLVVFDGETFYPRGDWDFSEATVKGL